MGKALKTGIGAVATIGGLFSKGFFKGSFSWWGLGFMAADMLLSGGGGSGKLDDLGVQTATEGAPLVRGWGTWRQAGNLVWSSGLKQHHKSALGKGGPKNSNYTYSTSFYILGGRGPITRLNKVFFNEHLVFDWNGGDEQGFTFSVDPDDGHLYAEAHGVTVRIYLGTPEQGIDPTQEAAKGVGHAVAYDNRWGIAIDNLPLDDYGNSTPNVTMEVYNSTTDLISIITEICSYVGLTEDDLDLSDLEGMHIDTGFVIESRQSAASALQQLMTAHFFNLVEADGVLRAVLKGKEPQVTLASRNLRIITPGQEMPNTRQTDRDETQIPNIVEVSFYDPKRRFNQGYRYGRCLETDSDKKDSIALTMAIDPQKAEQIAKIRVHEYRAQAEGYALQRDIEHLWLSAGDVVTIPTPTGTKDVVLSKITLPLFGPTSDVAPISDANLYNPPLPPASGSGVPNAVVPVFTTPQFVLMNLPSLRDQDTTAPLFYFAATGNPWAGARLNSNIILDTSYGPFSKKGEVAYPAIIGTITAISGSYSGLGDDWDDDTTITVDVVGSSLAGTTDNDVLGSSTNSFAWRNGTDDWEVAAFVNRTYVGDFSGAKRYTLSHLLRGRKGTEQFIAGHDVGDTFVLLDPDVIVPVPYAQSVIGTSQNFVVNYGTLMAQTENVTFTPQGTNMIPLSVIGPIGARDDLGSLTITWFPRTRFTEQFWQTGARVVDPAPPDENKYLVEILDGTDVVRTYTTTDTEQVYSSGSQIADGFTPGDPITVRVSRYSSVMGYGYPSETTI